MCNNQRTFLSVILFLYSFCSLGTVNSFADCTCQIGSNYISIIGFELIATNCPTEPFSDSQYFTYLMNPIKCYGSSIYNYSRYGDTSGSVSSVISYFVSQGYRVLRNPSGTHLLAVQKGNYPYTGTIAGVAMAGLSPGVYYTDPAEQLNEFCTDHPIQDNDNDGAPNCLDCAPEDSNFFFNCVVDNCPEDPNKTEPGICGCGISDIDSDGNGLVDCVERAINSGPPPSCQ